MTLSKEQRKAAINEFRERKSAAGAYSVKCIVNGRVWVGSSRNLDAAKNGIWFSLRTGGHRDKPLQVHEGPLKDPDPAASLSLIICIM